jgi:hypothetical protein
MFLLPPWVIRDEHEDILYFSNTLNYAIKRRRARRKVTLVNVSDPSPCTSPEHHVIPRPGPFPNTKAPELCVALNSIWLKHGHSPEAGQA